MSKDDLEPKMAQLMSDIAEVEGIIALDNQGNKISGQTIQEMNADDIAKTASSVLASVTQFGAAIGKGNGYDVTIGLEDGYAVIVVGSSYSIVAFVDKDSKSQLALLSRTIKNTLL